MGQIWFQNQSIETEVVRSDRFCCPIAFPLVNAMTHLVANHYFHCNPFSLQNGSVKSFCSDRHWLLIHHKNTQTIL